MQIKEYREFVATHLALIREQVDKNHSELKKVNGRLRKAEIDISWIKGIGASVTFIITLVVSLLYYIKG